MSALHPWRARREVGVLEATVALAAMLATAVVGECVERVRMVLEGASDTPAAGGTAPAGSGPTPVEVVAQVVGRVQATTVLAVLRANGYAVTVQSRGA